MRSKYASHPLNPFVCCCLTGVRCDREDEGEGEGEGEGEDEEEEKPKKKKQKTESVCSFLASHHHCKPIREAVR